MRRQRGLTEARLRCVLAYCAPERTWEFSYMRALGRGTIEPEMFRILSAGEGTGSCGG
jgi:hypothetical protein